MIKLKNKFAIGCIIQWYEIEIVEEYLQSVKNAVDQIENKKNVVIDLHLDCSQSLEKVDENHITISEVKQRYAKLLKNIFGFDDSFDGDMVGCDYNIKSYTNDLSGYFFTISDYRRTFNDTYCDKVDVLMWGETDSLIPKQTFEVLDLLHTNNINQNTHKYLAFFGTCKMWDEGWKVLEHNDFTDKPFIEGDDKNWWSLRYCMNIEEMNEINDKVEELDVRVVNPYKFNGCGLVISSDVIKSGVNVPKSIMLVHEDTAFQNVLIKMFNGNIPQFIFKNILLVHNRKHPKKRMYVLGEDRKDINHWEKRNSNSWYKKVWKLDQHNAWKGFEQGKVYTWEDVFEDR